MCLRKVKSPGQSCEGLCRIPLQSVPPLGIPLQSVPGLVSSGAELASGFLCSDGMDLGVPMSFKGESGLVSEIRLQLEIGPRTGHQLESTSGAPHNSHEE